MSIPARLSRLLHRTLGEQGADDLVNWMTKVESGRSELNEVMAAWRVATDAQFAAIGSRFDGIDRRLDAMDRRFDRLDGRLDSLFRWSFVFWIGSVGATLAIVHYVR
jgi:hypothetical protein